MSLADNLLLFESAAPAEAGGRELFFVQLARALEAAEEGRLAAALRAGRRSAAVAGGFVLLPRVGTVSPWSSKATGILQGCGLAAVRRVERGWWFAEGDAALARRVCDEMRQEVLFADEAGGAEGWRRLFAVSGSAAGEERVALGDDAVAALAAENARRGLALTGDEVRYLAGLYGELGRAPTVAELMMVAQANSEHCRHKIFNAVWDEGAGDGGDGGEGVSLMGLIRRTHEAHPGGVVTAFNDNAAVIRAGAGGDFFPDDEGVYRAVTPAEGLLLVAKAETHNHPTAISPFPGAATGSGGEIRDEAAAGRGAAARAGFCGYMVSAVDDDGGGGEAGLAPPRHVASGREVMTQAPLGAAGYNNEFGRAALAGFYRCYLERRGGRVFGFHKPVMLAGGLGHMLPSGAGKGAIPPGALIVQLGGEGFRIGIGGGAASSRGGGGDARADFASVQRDNAEMQRRAQQVLDALRRRADNPILSLHDVGAGGLANAVCELVHDAGRGARVDLNAVPVGEGGMSAAEVWCNESQERYVLAILPGRLALFEAVCRRERCPFAVIGEATAAREIVAARGDEVAVRLPLEGVFGAAGRLRLRGCALAAPPADAPLTLAMADLTAAGQAVLAHPAVACKRFLITIGDRTVGGLTARDQLVGPWQTAVADCAVICHDFAGVGGAAFALGERAPVAAIAPAAAARVAIAEALLNLAAADVSAAEVKLSLNWMANCGDVGRDSELRAAVRAASDFCVALGVGVIVGKDSLSMRMPTAGGALVESPAFAAAFAFAPLADVRRVWTPQLSGAEETLLMRVGFAADEGRPALGGSVAALAGVFAPLPAEVPDVCPRSLAAGLRLLSCCRGEGLVLAYHDCADGGLWAALCEMAFAGNCGLEVFAETIGGRAPETDGAGGDGWPVRAAAALFEEGPAAVIEVRRADAARVMALADAVMAEGGGGTLSVQTVARPLPGERVVRVYAGGDVLLREGLADLRRVWERHGAEVAAGRENPACVAAERGREMDADGGLFSRLPDGLPPYVQAPPARPRVAVLRDVGCNGQREMAAAFDSAGFEAVDAAMADLLDGRVTLESCAGVALCGGFSYGDVLGAGRGWALGVLHDAALAEAFRAFFARADSFALGVCNGCQALSHLQSLMPDAGRWRFPDFLPNESRSFEARLAMVEVLPSASPLFAGMAGLMFPIVVSHGEGRAVFADDAARARAATLLRYVDHEGEVAAGYPYNPNGSAGGATGFCSPDGRITALMPHPERVFRRVQMSWQPPMPDGEGTPWRLIFENARRFVG